MRTRSPTLSSVSLICCAWVLLSSTRSTSSAILVYLPHCQGVVPGLIVYHFHDFGGEICQRLDLLDCPPCDCCRRHPVDGGTCLILCQSIRAMLPHCQESGSSIVPHTGQQHPHRR